MTLVTPGWLVWLAAAAVAVSVGLAAGPLPWRFMGESGLPAPDVPEPAPATARVTLEPILALMPFGRAAAPEAPAAAQETGLGLTLHGVVIAAPPGVSSAIISGEGAPARAYSVGDEVAAGTTLVEVAADQVILQTGGAQETLSFPEQREAGTTRRDGSAPATDSSADALRALIAQPEREPEPEPEATAAAPAGASEDPEAIIATWRSRVQTNPGAVLDRFGLVAGQGGYTVGAEAPAATRAAGLRPGDVVTQVNGQQVGNIERDQRLFDEVVASGRARVEVVRDGQPIVMSFPLR